MFSETVKFIDQLSVEDVDPKKANAAINEVLKQKSDLVWHVYTVFAKHIEAYFNREMPVGNYGDLLRKNLKAKVEPPKFDPDFFHSSPQIDQTAKRIIRAFISPDYAVPDEPYKTAEHLFILFVYLCKIAPASKPLPMIYQESFDLSTMKLIFYACHSMDMFHRWGKEGDRTSKGTHAKKSQGRKSEGYILDAYDKIYHKIIDRGETPNPHKLSKEILEELRETRTDLPSIDTIKRCLKEHGKK